MNGNAIVAYIPGKPIDPRKPATIVALGVHRLAKKRLKNAKQIERLVH